MNNPLRISICLLSICALLQATHACRYSVRDVGFVDIHPDPYRLRLISESIESQKRARDLLAVSGIALMETNIFVESASASEYSDYAEATVALESPDPQISPLINSGSLEFWSLSLEAFASSKVRDRYLERMFDIYAAILFIESEDPQANQEASEAIESAVSKTKAYMTQIPKPVNEPPDVITVANDDTEEVLLWSLGIEDRSLPHVAVLFGRGRRIGDVLSGAAITTEYLFEILSVVGLDCECGLDRSWMQGVRIPLRWDEQIQEDAARALGFDPENPMVKMEISQILSQGGSGSQRNEGEPADPFLGYSERSVSYKELDFEPEREGVLEETSATAEQKAPQTTGELEPDLQVEVASVDLGVTKSSPSLDLWAFRYPLALGLSIFAVGFYILFSARSRNS